MLKNYWLLVAVIAVALIVGFVVSATTGNAVLGLRDGSRTLQHLITGVALCSFVAALIMRRRGARTDDEEAQRKRDKGTRE